MGRSVWIAGALVPVLLAAAVAAPPDRNSRPLTRKEQKSFFALVCKAPIRHDKAANCAAIRDYPGNGPGEGPYNISLTAIISGTLTRAGADQAYVTYATYFEPHVNNFGGGILFERKKRAWKLVRWYPGGQMDHCLALPSRGAAQFLCQSGYTGQGEVDSSVWLQHVAPTNDRDAITNAMKAVLRAQDGRRTMNPDYQCDDARGQAVLLSVDGLRRSTAQGVFAESPVTYASPVDAAAACRKHDFAHVRETRGTVRFRLRGGAVLAETPAKFASADY